MPTWARHMWLLNRHMLNGWVSQGKSGPQFPLQIHMVVFNSLGIIGPQENFANMRSHLHAHLCELNAATTPRLMHSGNPSLGSQMLGNDLE